MECLPKSLETLVLTGGSQIYHEDVLRCLGAKKLNNLVLLFQEWSTHQDERICLNEDWFYENTIERIQLVRKTFFVNRSQGVCFDEISPFFSMENRNTASDYENRDNLLEERPIYRLE